MDVKAFYDSRTYTLTYVAWDPETRDAVIVDPVLDYDPVTGRIWEESNQRLIEFVDSTRLKVRWILETHAHADHLSGSQSLKKRYGAGVVIGAGITEVQATFAPVFGFGKDFPLDGSQFDRLVTDGEQLAAGGLTVRALHTPGHTPACMSYLIGDAVFTGDALFMPDYGVGRCDFPRGSAETLYRSVHDTLYALPGETRVFVGHDYQPGGRALAYESTIAEEREKNVQLRAETAAADFVAFRQARDAKLDAPRLLLPSIQVNIAAGCLPQPGADGRRYLKIPLRLPAQAL